MTNPFSISQNYHMYLLAIRIYYGFYASPKVENLILVQQCWEVGPNKRWLMLGLKLMLWQKWVNYLEILFAIKVSLGAWNCCLVVGHLPSMCDALGLILSSAYTYRNQQLIKIKKNKSEFGSFFWVTLWTLLPFCLLSWDGTGKRTDLCFSILDFLVFRV